MNKPQIAVKLDKLLRPIADYSFRIAVKREDLLTMRITGLNGKDRTEEYRNTKTNKVVVICHGDKDGNVFTNGIPLNECDEIICCFPKQVTANNPGINIPEQLRNIDEEIYLIRMETRLYLIRKSKLDNKSIRAAKDYYDKWLSH